MLAVARLVLGITGVGRDDIGLGLTGVGRDDIGIGRYRCWP